MDAPTFKIKHIGINSDSPEHAEQLITSICDIFGLKRCNEHPNNVFAGSLFEIMRNKHIGTHGHIALQTDNVEYAIAYFREKGINIREETVRRTENGSIYFAYLELDIGGFSVHLTT